MFCYCPLYFIECPVNVPLLSNGLKDCMECTVTHRGKKAWTIVRKYLDRHWEKCNEAAQIYFIFNLFPFSSYLYRLFAVCSYVVRSTKKRMVGMIEKIDFTKDSEYIRLFDDDDSEEFMESVYKKELGSSFEKMENGVSVGNYEEEE